jgi:sugar lactone lactonase YvrE
VNLGGRIGPYRLKSVLLSADAHVDMAIRMRSRIAFRRPPRTPIHGTGDVFLAEDLTTQPPKEVVLKLLDPAATANAETLADLRDTYRKIGSVESFGSPSLVECGPRLAVLMTSIKAPSLAEKIRIEGPIELGHALDRFRGVAAALNVVDIAHGRLTPGRLLVDDVGAISIVGWDTGRLDAKGRPQAADDVAALARILLTMLCGAQATDDSLADVPRWLADVLRPAITRGRYAGVVDLWNAVDAQQPRSYDYTPPPSSAIRGAGGAVVALAVLGALAMGGMSLMATARPSDQPSYINVGSTPLAVASAPGALAFTSNFGDGTVSRIPGRGPATEPIPVSGHPVDLVADPRSALLYVSQLDGSIAVVDTATRRVRRISVGPDPRGLAVGASGRLYVATAGTDVVAVVDPSAEAVTDRIRVPGHPVAVVARPGGATVYVVTHNPATLVPVVDAAHGATALPPIPLPSGFSPEHAVVTTNGVVYLSDPNSRHLVAVGTAADGPTPARLPDVENVTGMALSRDEATLYLARRLPNEILAIRLPPQPGRHDGEDAQIHALAELPDEPGDLALSGDGRDLVVAFPGAGRVLPVRAG